MRFAVALSGLFSACGTSHVEVIEQSNAPATTSAPTQSSSAPSPPPTSSAPVVVSAPIASTPEVEPVSSEVGALDAAVPIVIDAAAAVDAGPPSSCIDSGAFAVARYRVVLRANGNCLGAGAETTSEGRAGLSTVVAADCGPDPFWQVIAVPGGYFEIRNLTSGFTLETFNGIASQGIDMVLMLPARETTQQFTLIPMGGPYYAFSLRAYPSRCVTQSFTGKAELVDCDPADTTQHWQIEDYTCRVLDGGT